MILFAPCLAAEPPGVLVWLEPALPSGEAAVRAARLTSGASPYAWGDYAFLRGDESDADRARFAAVGVALETARKRWDDFDVELGIAQQLHAAVEAVEILRGDADRAEVSRALLVAGLATRKAFPAERFGLLDEAASLRVMVNAQPFPRAWRDLLALEPERLWDREELGDTAGLAALDEARRTLLAEARAVVRVPELPAGTTAMLDGRQVAAGDHPVPPGRHYLHVLVGDRLAGRTRLDLASGQVAELPFACPPQVLREARAAVLEGRTLPTSADVLLAPYRELAGQPTRLYVAATEGGEVVVKPLSEGATLARPRPFSALLIGEVGGGLLQSEAFYTIEGQRTLVGQFGPHLALQFGVYNAFVVGGGMLYVTPTEQVLWAEGETDAKDTVAPLAARPYVGLGGYFPAPTNGSALLQIAATWGWMLPGSSGPGGTVAVGIPTRQDNNWLRFSVDGYTGVQAPSQPAPGTRNFALVGRIGFGRKL